MEALEEFSKVVQVLHRDGPQQPLDNFQDWAFGLVKPLVNFDAGFWGSGAWPPQVDAPIIHNLHLHGLPAEMTLEWEAIKATPQDRALTGKVFAAQGRSVVFQTAELAAHPLYPRWGVRQMVTSYVQDPASGLFDVISFYRGDPHHSLGEEERRLHQALVPHLLQVERQVRLRHLDAHCLCETGRQNNRAVCDDQGMLRLAQPGFVDLLRAEWPSWRGPRLPEPLLAKLTSGGHGHGKSFVGDRAVIRSSRQHDMHLLAAKQRAPADTLSRREREVADHWRHGHSYKEIAAAMGISPATVRNHLSKVYEKLSVTNRVQLDKALGGH